MSDNAIKTLGKLLADRRQRLQYTQKDIAARIGYPNSNFVNMVEVGRAKVPLEKARDFAHAYSLNEPRFYQLLLKMLYPDIWAIVKCICRFDSEFAAQENVDEALEAQLKTLSTTALFVG